MRKVVVAGKTMRPRLSKDHSSPCVALRSLEATMKKTLLITGVLLALTASVASAAGVNLFWNDCSLGGTSTTNRNFTCASNSGSNIMTASFDPPAGITNLNGNNLILDLISATPAMPQWWALKNVGTCRLASLGANTVFSAASCTEPWAAAGNGAISAYLQNVGGDARRCRIGGTVSVDGALETAISAGTEYYSLNITVNNAKTVGTGACDGCLEPVCIVFNEIKLTQPAGFPAGSPVVTNPAVSNYITWQGYVSGPGANDCPAATPTINRTWGQVKSLYR